MKLTDKLKASALALSLGLASAGCFTPAKELPSTFPPKPRQLDSFSSSPIYLVSKDAMNAYRSTLGLVHMPLCNRTTKGYSLTKEQSDDFIGRCTYGLKMSLDRAEAYREVFSLPSTMTMTTNAMDPKTLSWEWPHEEFHRLEDILPQDKEQVLNDTHKKIISSSPIKYDPDCLIAEEKPDLEKRNKHLQDIEQTMTNNSWEFYAYLAQCPAVAEKYLAPYPETYRMFNEMRKKSIPVSLVKMHWLQSWRF